MMTENIVLERPRINTMLEKALEKPVVFIVAGEGYGKTWTVRSFLEKKKRAAIWISLSERDNVPRHFWESITRAVTVYDPRAGRMLEEIGFPESPGQLSRCFLILASTERDRNRYAIVVDDCHLVNSEPVIKFVNRLLAPSIPRGTIIMMSRSESPLNAMTLLSKGLMTRISDDDLRFNEEETDAYFRLMNMDLPPEVIKSIHTDTEGWILAISLIAEEMKNNNAAYSRSFLESGSFLKMEDELFASIPESHRRFLVMFSLFEQWPLEPLERIAASLPEKLPAMEEFIKNSGGMSSLFRYDTFIHGFRIHPVFLDYLRKKQKDLRKDEEKTACLTAAGWYMENCLWTEAAANYGRAGEYREVLRAIYSSTQLISQSSALSLLNIIDRIIANNEGKEKDGKERDGNFLFLRHVTRAAMLLNLGRYDESRLSFEESVREFETDEPDKMSSLILSVCYNTLGSLSFVTYRMNRDLSRALEYFRRSNFHYRRYPYVVRDPMTSASIGSYAITIGYPVKNGEFEEFIRTVAECIPYASESIGGNLSGMDNLCQAELAFFREDLNNAEQYAREALFIAREKKQYEVVSKCLFYLLRIQLHSGNLAAGNELWKQLETQLDIQDYSTRYVIYDIISGWYYAHTGATELIAPWLTNEFEESNLNLLYHNYETMVKAKSLYAEKRYEEALGFLEKKEVREGLGSFYFGLLEITVLKAVIHNSMGNEAAAISTMEISYEMSKYGSSADLSGEPEFFCMPFIELGEDMRLLSTTALNSAQCSIPKLWLETIRNKASVYAKKLALLKIQYKRLREEAEIPFLSSQELSVLAGISRGMTREEIAKDLSTSINTVKNILKTVYDKLGAYNKADAIRIASGTGLLKNQYHEKKQ